MKKVAVCLLFFLAAVNIAAAFTAGSGTIEQPYQISTLQDLEAVNENLAAHYILVNDIDLTDLHFDKAIIAYSLDNSSFYTGVPFTGSFDGNHFAIKNLTIDQPARSFVAIFGKVGQEGEIRNLSVENCLIKGSYWAAALVSLNEGSVINSHSTGRIIGSYGCGGLIGKNSGEIISSHCLAEVLGGSGFNTKTGGLTGSNSGEITKSYFSGTVSGSISSTNGGLAGINDSGVINQSYSMGTVSGSNANLTGGLVGSNYKGLLQDCYSHAETVGSSSYSAGLAAQCIDGRIINCYSKGKVSGSTTGGLVAQATTNWDYEDTANFWDFEASQQPESAMGLRKHTYFMTKEYFFIDAGWDFDNIWISSGLSSAFEGYPVFDWQLEYYTVTFSPGDYGTMISGDSVQEVPEYKAAAAPVISAQTNRMFAGWDTDFDAVTSDLTVTAMYVYAKGDGSDLSPYQISNIQAVEAINYNLKSNYKLLNDIDLSGIIFTESLIASTDTNQFAGTFDGNGYCIKNLTIQAPEKSSIAFMGYISYGGEVKNLAILDCNITGKDRVSSLAAQNTGTIESCYSTGVVNSSGDYSAGFAAYNLSGAVIKNCYSNVRINGYCFVAGFVAVNNYSKIINCYSTGKPTGIYSMGGFVVSARSNEDYADIFNYWDTTASGTTASSMGIGKTTSQLQNTNTFLLSNWDFVNESRQGKMDVWYIHPNDYPRLFWQADIGDIDYSGEIDKADLGELAWQWLNINQQEQRLSGDINKDGVVNILDYAIYAAAWQKTILN